jgi:hypothetical protein
VLSERPEFPLDGLLEIDESYYGGRSKPESRSRGLTDPNISLMAIAIETIPASTRQGERIRKSRFVVGGARIAVLPAATAAHLGHFVRGAAKPAPALSPMVRRVTTLSPTASAIIRSFKTAAKNAIPCCPSRRRSNQRCGAAAPQSRLMSIRISLTCKQIMGFKLNG